MGFRLRAFNTNGASHGTLFSGIVSSTRNTTLDTLKLGYFFADVPWEKEVKKTKLMFGVLGHGKPFGNGNEEARLGFGVEGEVGGFG